MHIKNAKEMQGVESPSGEVIYELMGTAAGGSRAHSLAQIVLPPGKFSGKHYHPVAEESYFILSSTARMELDGEIKYLRPGDSVIILPHQVHRITNNGDDDLIFLAICVPAWTPDNSVFVD